MKSNHNRSDRVTKGRRHFKEGLEFWIKPSRRGELRKLLKGWGLRPEKDYIFEIRSRDFYSNVIFRNTALEMDQSQLALVSFKARDKAALFRLSWTEDEEGSIESILPFIRRVMPNIIAHDIIGVQPMSGPVASVHTLVARYR